MNAELESAGFHDTVSIDLGQVSTSLMPERLKDDLDFLRGSQSFAGKLKGVDVAVVWRLARRNGEMAFLTGTCMCGAVTWTYSGDTTRNLVCHCIDCQRATSAPFTAFLGMKPEQLKWAGNIVHYESSPKTFRGFCPYCGTRLYFRSEKWPFEVHVHAATMTDPGKYRPRAQVVMRSRAEWLDQLRSIPAFEDFQENPSKHPSSETY